MATKKKTDGELIEGATAEPLKEVDARPAEAAEAVALPAPSFPVSKSPSLPIQVKRLTLAEARELMKR